MRLLQKNTLKKVSFSTKIALDQKQDINSVIFDISSLKKLNYGINELKFYKILERWPVLKARLKV